MSSWSLLVLALMADPSGNLASVRLERGQELVYRGAHTWTPAGGVGTPVAIESRAFVLDVSARGMQLALCTELRSAGESCRLGTLTLDARGRYDPPARERWQNPPALDPGIGVELPPGGIAVGSTWDTMPPGGPPAAWVVEAEEPRCGARALRLHGERQSHSTGCDLPDGTRTWRAVETVWLHAATGLVLRRERRVEYAGSGPGVVETYVELDGSFTYPTSGEADRRAEIALAIALNAGATSSNGEARLKARAARHLESRSETPYRPAVLAALARLGTTNDTVEPADEPLPAMSVGQVAPDFAAPCLDTGAMIRLSRLRGKPVVLLLFRPGSVHAAATFELLHRLREKHGDAIACVALATNASPVRAWGVASGWSFPVLAGRDAAAVFGPAVTPRLLLLDANGTVRLAVDGWGPEVAKLAERALDGER